MSLDEKPDTAVNTVETSHSSIEKIDTTNVAENLTAISQPPSPWGKGHRTLYFCCLLVYLCSTMNGNPIPPFSLTLAMI